MKFNVKSIKIQKLNNILVNLLFIISMLSYEKTIHNRYYDLALIGVFGVGIILFVINISNGTFNIKYSKQLIRNKLLHLLTVLLLLSSFFNSMILSLSNFRNFLNVILLIFSLYIFYLFIPLLVITDINKLLDRLGLLITVVSIVGIYIYIKGSLFYYYPIYNRASSFMFDPNYFGSFAAVGVLLCIKKNKKFFALSVINIIALYYSGSRGALLSLILSLLIGYMFRKGNFLRKIVMFILILTICLFLVYVLYNLGYFRIQQGTTGRDILWRTSIRLISEQPIWGYGNFSVPFKSAGMVNSGSHSALIDFALRHGLIALSVYTIIIIKSFLKGVKNNIPMRLIFIIIMLSINMNSIVISLGGLGGLSLIFTLSLGISNAYRNVQHNNLIGK